MNERKDLVVPCLLPLLHFLPSLRNKKKMSLPVFKLERWFAKYEFSAQYLLCSSDCQSMSIGDLLRLASTTTTTTTTTTTPAEGHSVKQQLEDVWLGYTETVRGLHLCLHAC